MSATLTPLHNFAPITQVTLDSQSTQCISQVQYHTQSDSQAVIYTPTVATQAPRYPVYMQTTG